MNIVRALDSVIEYQSYPVGASMKMLKRRSIGVGVTNLAYYLAKNGVTYDDPEACNIVDELMEHIQYYMIKASIQLAKERGKCEWFHKTKYAEGVLPIDTYAKEVDKIVTRERKFDWDILRKSVLKDGMRNSTLTALMPCESTSLVTNSTNGITTRLAPTFRRLMDSDPPRQSALAEIHEGRNHVCVQECPRRSLLRSPVRV